MLIMQHLQNTVSAQADIETQKSQGTNTFQNFIIIVFYLSNQSHSFLSNACKQVPTDSTPLPLMT